MILHTAIEGEREKVQLSRSAPSLLGPLGIHSQVEHTSHMNDLPLLVTNTASLLTDTG